REGKAKTAEKAPARTQPRAGSAEPARDPRLVERRKQYREDYGLSAEDAEILTRDGATAALFDEAIATGVDARAVANWIIHELPREAQGRAVAELPITGESLAELVELVETGTISSSGGREVLAR